MTAVNFSISSPQLGSPKPFQCRDLLPDRPHTVWQIDRGIVRTLTWDDRGNITTLGFWGEGHTIGQPLSQMYPFEMQCLTPVQVRQLPIVYLLEDTNLQSKLVEQLALIESLLVITHYKSTVDRLMGLLEWLAKRFGRDAPQGRWVRLRLTHQEIAETIGASRVTVTRLLKELERCGKIDRSRPDGFFVRLF